MSCYPGRKVLGFGCTTYTEKKKVAPGRVLQVSIPKTKPKKKVKKFLYFIWGLKVFQFKLLIEKNFKKNCR